jgi:hypothetical protein
MQITFASYIQQFGKICLIQILPIYTQSFGCESFIRNPICDSMTPNFLI